MSKNRLDQTDQSEFITEFCNENLNINEEKKIQDMCLSNKTLTLNEKGKKDKTEDLSSISQCSEFVIRNSIQNSIFNPNEYFSSEKNDEDFFKEKIGYQHTQESNMKNEQEVAKIKENSNNINEIFGQNIIKNKKHNFDFSNENENTNNIKIVDLDNKNDKPHKLDQMFPNILFSNLEDDEASQLGEIFFQVKLNFTYRKF